MDHLKTGIILNSKKDGKFEILSIINPRNKQKTFNVTIKWLNTGNINKTSINSIITGNCRDLIKRRLNFDKIYHCKIGGDFKILKQVESINGHLMVEIEFLNSKAHKITRWTDVYNEGKCLSNVRDDFSPTVAGIVI